MGGQAYDGKRMQAFLVGADEVVVVGLDTDDGAEHPLYDERVKDPVDEATVQSVMALGVLQPITVRKSGASTFECVMGGAAGRARCARRTGGCGRRGSRRSASRRSSRGAMTSA